MSKEESGNISNKIPSRCPSCNHELEVSSSSPFVLVSHLKLHPEQWINRIFHRLFISDNKLPKNITVKQHYCGKCKRELSVLESEEPIEVCNVRYNDTTNTNLTLERLIIYFQSSYKHIPGLLFFLGPTLIILGITGIVFHVTDLIWGSLEILLGIGLCVYFGSVIYRGLCKNQKAAPATLKEFPLKKYFFLNIGGIGIIWVFLVLIPSLITKSFELLLKNYGSLIVPIFLAILLTIFQFQLFIIRKNFIELKNDFQRLEGKESVDYKEFKEISIRRFFFGKMIIPGDAVENSSPSGSEKVWKIIEKYLPSPPTILGLIGFVIGLYYFHYYFPSVLSFYEIPHPDSQLYTSLPFYICRGIFYSFMWITMGIVVWLSLSTPYFITLIARDIPLKCNPLHAAGGPERFGDILISANIPIVVLALGFLAFVRYNPILPIAFNIFLLCLFAIAVIIGFLYPLYIIHHQMHKLKQDEIEELTNRINYGDIKTGNMDWKETNQNILLFQVINKISTKSELPFNRKMGLITYITMTVPPVAQIIQSSSIIIIQIQSLLSFKFMF